MPRMPPDAKKLRSFLADLALASASTVVALLLLEAGLHVATGARYLDLEHRLKEGSLAYEPSQKRRWKRPEWDVELAINSRGFRDQEWAAPSPSKSVLFLGDSFVEGYGVDLDKTMVKRLETALRRDGHEHRVYNGGIQGRGPASYFQIYEDFFRAQPDVKVVVLAFFLGNDVETGPRSGYLYVPDRRNLTYQVKRFLSEHSTLYNFVRRAVKTSRPINALFVRAGLVGATWVLDPNTFDPRSKPHWDFTADWLKRFAAEVKADKRRLMVVLIPQKEMVEDDFFEHVVSVTKADRSQIDRFALAQHLASSLQAAGVEVLDLTPAFRAAEAQSPREHYFRTDGHWNPEGQSLAAEEVHQRLKKANLLKSLH